MIEAGVIGEEGEIIIEKMRDAFLSGNLEIKSLSESLGREKTDAIY